MDKNAIKKYAVWARRELIDRVAKQAEKYGVTADGWGDADANSVGGRLLSETEKDQRIAFIGKIQAEGYEQTVEEAAYTWFNRFCALRYMEVNGYLPSRVRVFTNEAGEFRPQIIDEAIHLDIDGLDIDKVFELKADVSLREELFRYLLITQCNALSSILPGLFRKIADYTELLLPEYLLREGSVIERLVEEIPEEDWTDQVQIIGWLYQYYNAEKKDEVFAALKKNVKITKENIPAATQLFTPDWIVRYMVENSLGRLWVEGHPNDNLKSGWKYYLEEAQQEPEVEAQLAQIRKGYAALKPEDIKCIDPCAGSGHILCYLFDVLLQIHESYGYTTREAVSSIVENNLYGLDIDERAAQLAYFAVMMKARSYDRRFFSRGVQPHVYAIRESNDLDRELVEYFVGGDPKIEKDFGTLAEELHDAKEYGSILNVSQVDFDALYARTEELKQDVSFYDNRVDEQVMPLIRAGQALAQKYDVVVTNPPYMGPGTGTKLSAFVKKYYPDSKSDMFAVFIERCGQMIKECGYQAMITQHAWMFLSSYEKLRVKIMQQDIVNMAHLGARAFEEIGGEVVQTTSFVLRRSHVEDYKGMYCRLIEPTTQQGKEGMFLAGENRFIAQQGNFTKIPGSPVAYWCSNSMLKVFTNGLKIASIAKARKGLVTGNDDLYLKLWYEIRITDFSVFFGWDTKWKPINKGGNYRKWYGNNNYVVNWGTDGSELANHRWPDGRQRSSLRNSAFFFKEAITWTYITSVENSFRYYPDGFAFAGVGPGLIPLSSDNLLMILSYCNSVVFREIEKMVGASTISLESGEVEKSPIIIPQNYIKIDKLTIRCIKISKDDWDSFETSWDFTRHPLVRPASTVAFAYAAWEQECDTRFTQLKSNEEELNRIFIDIYGLKDELSPEVEDKDVTVRKANLQRDIRSLISYAVGCMFGRYSLDVDGLAYAGGEWDPSKYTTFIPDKDAILPICDDEYFTDDIVNRFVDFIRIVYGEDTLEENLKFIADALCGSGSSREVIRKYFLNDFYADHCKIYQKRPIYWLFDSGKKNGFKCLVYLHRYRPDTVARVRTDYVHEQQSRYRTAIADLENRIAGAAASERVKLNKQLKRFQDQADEVHDYEEKIHHLADQFIDIDLDDGVKVNYAKFQDVLAKIK